MPLSELKIKQVRIQAYAWSVNQAKWYVVYSGIAYIICMFMSGYTETAST